MSRRIVSRRNLIRGAAASALMLPWLGSLEGSRAQAEGSVFPKRFIVMFNPNGTIQDSWWPKDGADEYSFTLNEIHQPLAEFKDRLVFLSGMNIVCTHNGPGGPHQRGMGGLLTGRQLQTGSFMDGCGSLAGWGGGISVDQEIANTLGTTTKLRSLELGIRATEAEVRTRLNYLGPNLPLPPQNSPHEVYLQVFSDLMISVPELEKLRARRKSVLDTVQSQMKYLESRISTSDRQRLESHAEMVRNIEKSLDSIPVTTNNCHLPEEPMAMEPDSEDNMPAIAKLQIDMLVMALTCDLTRVGTLQFSNAINHIRFPWLSSLGDGHGLSHMGPSNTEARAELVARDKWYASQLAYLMKQLQSIPEGEGTLLDSTLIFWGNELAEGNTHSHQRMPFLLAGNAGSSMKTGRYLKYDNVSHNNMLVSILNAMGIPATSFGDPNFCTGPLPGLV